MRKHRSFSNIILILVFLVGLSLLLYPTVSDYWNFLHQSRAIAQYSEEVAALDKDNYEEIWQAAERYNETLRDNNHRFIPTEEEKKEYESLLNVSGDGIIGYIEIPSINCSLPFYHGTDEAVLQVAIGHIEGSSLPVGGAGTHCVLSGHRGLPSSKLFTNLDQLTEGDIFMLRVLNQTLTYEVDQILIVEPQEVEALNIEEGKDYCTLITCTPYGINTHRLLVRGHRIENQDAAEEICATADAVQINPYVVALAIAVPMLLLLLFLTGKKRK